MPIQTTNIDQTSSGVAAISITTNEMLAIAANIVVQSEAGNGIRENDGTSGNGEQILNYGFVSAADYGIFTTSAVTWCFIDNAAGASIVGARGIDISELDDTIVNAGSIVGTSVGIDDEASFLTVRNSGDIFGGVFGAELGPGDSLNNSGSISSNDTGVQMAVTTNLGAINNAGTIEGTHRAVAAYGSSQFTLVNKGKIDGDVILTTSGADLITNTGTIDGSVELGSGFNTFNGRRGTVTGTLTGGTGLDTIYLGNDGETVDGGGGLDQVYGGLGADTFAFSHDGATNAATIHGFNVGNDAIELSHSLFTKLVVGATPTFAISNYATSVSDHLFYNTTGGSLWYDSNGSAAGGVVEIANLGAGLKLAASNFTVV
jgi:hypothetical protein